MLYDDLVQPGEYICHHGVKGQKWGVRHEKDNIKQYKTNVKKAYKEYIQKLKELGINKIKASRSDFLISESELNKWASNKSKELFNEYIQIKKDNNEITKPFTKTYFYDIRSSSASIFSSLPALTFYSCTYDPKTGQVYTTAHSFRYYQ